MRVLFLASRPEKPSYRFRVAAFLPHLRERGWDVRVEFVPSGWWARRRLFRGLGEPDVVFVQKRLFGALDLAAVRGRARRLVYDVDDAVMHAGEKRRFEAMVRRADLVLAGNEFLAAEVRGAGGRVEVLPTVVDTERYRPGPARNGGPVTIGWSGSASTNRYLEELLGGLERFRPAAPVRFLAVSDERPAGRGFDFVPWSDEKEVKILQGFDVGLMPLDDTPWSRGKCGLKAILSQATGAPVVCSDVGVNAEVVEDGRTGYVVRSDEEWAARLSALVEDPALRRRMGEAGRRRVEERYSVRAVLPRLVAALEGIA